MSPKLFIRNFLKPKEQILSIFIKIYKKFIGKGKGKVKINEITTSAQARGEHSNDNEKLLEQELCASETH